MASFTISTDRTCCSAVCAGKRRLAPASLRGLIQSIWTGLVLILLLGCSSPPPLHIAVVMPPLPAGQQRLALTWALDNVNASGGVAGRSLLLDERALDPRASLSSQQALAAQLAADDTYAAVIGLGNSETLAALADYFVQHKKPVISFTSSAADILRAYGGKGFIWRTRESDIAQTELLVRFAASQGAKRLALVASSSASGQTFFSWFGFFARDLGFSEDALHIEILDAGTACDSAMTAALQSLPDILFVAGAAPEDYECATRIARKPGQPSSPRLLFADTGLDLQPMLRTLGSLADGLEGFGPVSAATPSFEDEFRKHFGASPSPHAASEYDALLLLAYGLQVSMGQGGDDLVLGMKAAVDGRESSDAGWDAAAVTSNLSALRAGRHPDLQGATGHLTFEPELYTDLADSTMGHWEWRSGQRSYQERFFTGSPEFRSGAGVLVKNRPNTAQDLSTAGAGWTPSQSKEEVWALVAALSSGFNNYRHQADALRQYWLLREGGVPDDHIVLMLADDLSAASQNRLPGVVRGEPDGPNLRQGAEVDYQLTLSAPQLMDVLSGNSTAETPKVLHPTAASNLYVYLVGHGGQKGLPVGANSTSEGLAGRGSVLSPQLLRQTLCDQRKAGNLRRGLVVIESCFGGVFGRQQDSGLEAGCDGGTALDGVVLLSAANSTENSYAASYDSELSVWLADQFSQHVARFVQSSRAASLVDLYTSAYVSVAGSHVSIYNAAHAGRLGTVSLREFFAAGP